VPYVRATRPQHDRVRVGDTRRPVIRESAPVNAVERTDRGVPARSFEPPRARNTAVWWSEKAYAGWVTSDAWSDRRGVPPRAWWDSVALASCVVPAWEPLSTAGSVQGAAEGRVGPRSLCSWGRLPSRLPVLPAEGRLAHATNALRLLSALRGRRCGPHRWPGRATRPRERGRLEPRSDDLRSRSASECAQPVPVEPTPRGPVQPRGASCKVPSHESGLSYPLDEGTLLLDLPHVRSPYLRRSPQPSTESPDPVSGSGSV
jgi:hypothetical protein